MKALKNDPHCVKLIVLSLEYSPFVTATLSATPSTSPSERPTLSAIPSSAPSETPTLPSNSSSTPSETPTFSSEPSSVPSSIPSLSSNPSRIPSSVPSHVPSGMPSIKIPPLITITGSRFDGDTNSVFIAVTANKSTCADGTFSLNLSTCTSASHNNGDVFPLGETVMSSAA